MRRPLTTACSPTWTTPPSSRRSAWWTSISRRNAGNGVGALAGQSEGVIRAVYTTGHIKLTNGDESNTSGGIIGFNDTGTIIASHSHADVSGKARWSGGIVGFNGTDWDHHCQLRHRQDHQLPRRHQECWRTGRRQQYRQGDHHQQLLSTQTRRGRRAHGGRARPSCRRPSPTAPAPASTPIGTWTSTG